MHARILIPFLGLLAWFAAAEDAPAQGKTDERSLTLILVRHAEAYRNTPEREGAEPDKLDTLTPNGERQAAWAAGQLKERGVAAVVTSTAGRARQTAAAIAQATGLKDEPAGDEAFCPCGPGESAADKADRALKGAGGLLEKYDGKTVVAVTHQHIMLALLEKAAKDQPGAEPDSFRCTPASIAEIRIEAGRWRLVKAPVNPPEEKKE